MKEKNNDKKEECPHCVISEDTLEILKKVGKKRNSEKFSKKDKKSQ